MNGKQAEFRLGILYLSSLILSLTSTICIVIVWQYWSRTLNDCLEIDCGCILYSVNTYKHFRGGDVSLCQYPTYSLIPSMIIGLILGIYHGYRSCIQRNLNDPQVRTRVVSYYNKSDVDHENGGEVFVVSSKNRTPCKLWIIPGFLAAVVGLFSLAHAVVIIDGYYQTCGEYRKYIIQSLGSGGREAQAIHNRLSCSAIFDFMDYIQPDANYWRRGIEIYTSLFLQIAIVTSWINFFAWLLICGINIYMVKQKQNLKK